jgi:hypothetical protein
MHQTVSAQDHNVRFYRDAVTYLGENSEYPKASERIINDSMERSRLRAAHIEVGKIVSEYLLIHNGFRRLLATKIRQVSA